MGESPSKILSRCPALADAMPALGIENLQKMGTKFILCANALGICS
jgi:hypothetical protein